MFIDMCGWHALFCWLYIRVKLINTVCQEQSRQYDKGWIELLRLSSHQVDCLLGSLTLVESIHSDVYRVCT
jgi:hypothetical protein